MKKIILSGACTLLLVLFAAVAPLRSAALDAMSVFRVSQANTIRITVADIQELMTNLDSLGLLPRSMLEQAGEAQSRGIIGGADGPTELFVKPHVNEDILGDKALSSVDEFTAFDFKLAKSLDKTPILVSAPGGSKDITLDTRAINLALEKLDARTYLPESYDGGTVTINTPPAIAALYNDAGVILAAAQMPYVTAQDGVELTVLKDALLSSSLIPYNIAQQLAMIDVNTRDIYLPVLVGISREVNINGKTGYIYASSDLAALTGALGFGGIGDLGGDGVTAIVWVMDGAVYMVMSDMPEAELAAVARSVK